MGFHPAVFKTAALPVRSIPPRNFNLLIIYRTVKRFLILRHTLNPAQPLRTNCLPANCSTKPRSSNCKRMDSTLAVGSAALDASASMC